MDEYNNTTPQESTAPPQPTPQPQPAPQPVPPQPIQQQAQQTPYQPPMPNAGPQQAPQMQYQYQQGAVAVAPPKKNNKGVLIAVIAVICLIIAGILAAAVLFGGGPEKKFYGSWSATMDLTDSLKDALGDDADLLDDDYKFEFQVDFVFNEDKTYEMGINKESFSTSQEAFAKEIKASVRKLMIDTMKESLPTYSENELLDAFEQYYGKSLDDYVEEIMSSELDIDFDEISKSLDYKGQYKVDDDKFYLSDDLEHIIDEKTYAVYELKSDNEIYVSDYVVNGKSSDKVFTLPFTMIKNK